MVRGFRLPDRRPLTENEWLRIETLRAIAGDPDTDPGPTLCAVQALRVALMAG